MKICYKCKLHKRLLPQGNGIYLCKECRHQINPPKKKRKYPQYRQYKYQKRTKIFSPIIEVEKLMHNKRVRRTDQK